MAFGLNPVASMFAGVAYFHGRLTPEEANFRLNRRGCFDGLYLIYEDIEITGKYTLAICSKNTVRTYYLGVSADGQITYGNGQTATLMHPHELIHYHLQQCKGFPVRPLVPCLRPNDNDQKPMAWQSVTMEELELRMLKEAENILTTTASEVLRSERKQYLLSVAKQLHTHQPWFHGEIDRSEAERRLSVAERNQSDRKFLVRDKGNGTFALSMSYKADGQFRHYTVNRMETDDDGELLALDDEPTFANLMDIIEHYSTKPKSFVLALTSICSRPNYTKEELPRLESCAVEAQRAYVKETDHLQTPKEITTENRYCRKASAETENLIAVISEDRAKLNPRLKEAKKKSESTNRVQAEEDRKLAESIMSAVPSLRDDLLVTKVEIRFQVPGETDL